jgi:hypothetical protein
MVDVGWLSDLTTSYASTIKSDIIEAWKRRKKKLGSAARRGCG